MQVSFPRAELLSLGSLVRSLCGDWRLVRVPRCKERPSYPSPFCGGDGVATRSLPSAIRCLVYIDCDSGFPPYGVFFLLPDIPSIAEVYPPRIRGTMGAQVSNPAQIYLAPVCRLGGNLLSGRITLVLPLRDASFSPLCVGNWAPITGFMPSSCRSFDASGGTRLVCSLHDECGGLARKRAGN